MSHMTMREYADGTASTAVYGTAIEAYVDSLGIADAEKREGLISILRKSYVILGLVGEAGELANKMKKVIRDDHGTVTEERCEAMAGETGDVQWYTARTATEFGASLESVAQSNLDKLFGRRDRGTIQGSGDTR